MRINVIIINLKKVTTMTAKMLIITIIKTIVMIMTAEDTDNSKYFTPTFVVLLLKTFRRK